ncbi:MAG: hypothetical protein CM15mP93_14160 [Thiotrichaceae bacterium]|nr:MAG: hypothetical protein CM15mP93_14160 [Thiotrichaceae bacterium]
MSIALNVYKQLLIRINRGHYDSDLSKIQRLIILFGVLSVAAAGWSFLYSMDSNMKNMSGMGMNMKMDKSMGDMKMDKSMGDMKMDKSMGDRGK